MIYDYIISNRYVSANIIHQTGKNKDKKDRQEFIDWLEDLEYNIFGIPKPDITIFLNISPQLSEKLINKRGNRKDIHENDKNHMLNAYLIANNVAQSKKRLVKNRMRKRLKNAK